MKAMQAMKKVVTGAMTAMALIVGAGAAHAIDLRNEDEVDHQVTVTSTSMSRDLALRGLTLSLVVCVGQCEFDVPGVGSVKATGNDVVTIKNGTVTVTPAVVTRTAESR